MAKQSFFEKIAEGVNLWIVPASGLFVCCWTKRILILQIICHGPLHDSTVNAHCAYGVGLLYGKSVDDTGCGTVLPGVLIQLNRGDFVSAESAAFGKSTDQLRIWFGILALIAVELGLITPPVGRNVFVIRSVSPDTPPGTIFCGVLPFLLSSF